MGLLGTKASLWPRVLRFFIEFPPSSLSSNRQVQAVANQGMERMGDKGGAVKRNNSAAWGKVLVPHQTIHTLISFSCFVDTETPTRWEKLKVNNGMLPTST